MKFKGKPLGGGGVVPRGIQIRAGFAITAEDISDSRPCRITRAIQTRSFPLITVYFLLAVVEKSTVISRQSWISWR